jgi:predicted permease
MDSALLLILTCLALGYAFAKLRVLPENAADVLNRFVIYVCLPAVVLRLIPKVTYQPGLFVLVVTPWVLTAVSAAAVLLAARVFAFRREVVGALLLCVALGNTSFLGFPMITWLVSADAVRYAVLYDQFGSFLLLSTYGLYVVARFSDGGTPTFRETALRVVKFPPFGALLIAFVPFPHPHALTLVLERVGDTLVPLAMFAVGLKLELRPPRDALAFMVGLALKMLLAPLVAFGIAALFHAPDTVGKVAILEAGMPPMITAGAFAILAGLAPELAAALVGYGILLSLVTLPVLAHALR